MRLPARALTAVALAASAAALVPAGAAGASATASARAVTPASHPHSRLHLLAPATKFAAASSNNWFGYNQGGLSKGGRFTSIQGDWTVPTATRHSAADTSGEASSTWIGIGGGCVQDGCGSGVTDETLIQAGTEQDVAANGTASYNAWWEIIPEPETAVSLPVHPGDHMHVAIAEKLPAVWSITIRNVTTGKSFTTTTPYPGLGLSAEWIEETPLQIGVNAGLAALPNLSTVRFTSAKANGANANLKVSQELDLTDANGKVIGAPSAPNSTHDGFDACAWATTCS